MAKMSDSAIGRVLRLVIATVVVGVNVIGTAVVLVLTLVVIPLPRDHEVPWWAHVAAAAAYLLVAVPIGLFVGLRRHRKLMAWLRSGAPADARTRRYVLGLPLRLFWLQVLLWAGGATAFAIFEAVRNVERGLWVFVIVFLTGAVTAASAYLFTERLARPLARRALAGIPPAELRKGQGVAVRSLAAWALGSGIPLIGAVVLGVRTLAPSEVTLHQLAIAVVVLAGTGLVIGLQTVFLAARATADPVVGVARAMVAVGAGRFDTRVPVYDGTEIGRLQAGFNEMVAGLAEREQIREAFGTYVDPAVAEHILREGTNLAGEEIEVSVMFIDIRNFTGFAERTAAAEVVATINRLFERAVPLIRDNGGHVDKFVGDGLLAVFGAPRRTPDHADRAVRAALQIAAATEDEFGSDLSVGIGVNTGVVVAGNVGGAGRFEFSVIGDPVNVAARIESATRQTGDTVLISARTRELMTPATLSEVDLVERAGIALKGKSEAAALFGVRGAAH
ncbi:adenylate/guanylate cyclase domain-containing protein [Nocardioides montaniterrae]